MINQITIRNYYSMADILEIIQGNESDALYMISKDGGLFGFIKAVYEKVGRHYTFDEDTDETKELFKNYLWPEYYDMPLFYIDTFTMPWCGEEKPTDQEVVNESLDYFGRIYKWLHETKDRYIYLIKAYKDQEAKLLNQISSKSTTKFNDTPQDGGDFDTDNHLTNITAIETSADVATPIARLKEVKDNLRNLYSEWSNEFNRFIIFSA